MIRWPADNLKNRLYFTIIGVILLISATIALMARWILVSSLTDELENRGVAIAQSIAERAREHILDNNPPNLLSLIFDASLLGERKELVSYIFVIDAEGKVLAHTFIQPFPEDILPSGATPIESEIKTLQFGRGTSIDISVPIKEGIYKIGAVHVGLNKDHIDRLVGKLRITFLGFISLVITLIFGLSLHLAKTITQPLTRLTKISQELARGNFDVFPDMHENEKQVTPRDCPAYANTDLPCWHFDLLPLEVNHLESPLKLCKECRFYKKPEGDELEQLGNSFRNMLWSIKLYRRRLRESEEKYRSLFDSGPDPVMVVDYETNSILDTNPRAEEFYGYNRDELLSMKYSELDPEFTNRSLPQLEEAAGEGSCVYNTKVLQFTRNQAPVFVNLHACTISYRGKQAVIISITDITDMIEKDAQLIQASKMKTLGEMSAGIAHEINQPLNAIRMGSDYLSMMAEKDSVEPDNLKKVADGITSQVDRATSIINTLRAFGRKSDLRTQSVNVNESIHGVLNLIGRQLQLSGITIDLQLDGNLPTIKAHDNRLQQVLFNLLTNASDAISSHTSNSNTKIITIKSYFVNNRLEVEVSDTGTGIREKDINRILEPFYTTKASGQGMGLGLSISNGIVRDYGGRIYVTSTQNQGTTFRLSFPTER